MLGDHQSGVSSGKSGEVSVSPEASTTTVEGICMGVGFCGIPLGFCASFITPTGSVPRGVPSMRGRRFGICGPILSEDWGVTIENPLIGSRRSGESSNEGGCVLTSMPRDSFRSRRRSSRSRARSSADDASATTTGRGVGAGVFGFESEPPEFELPPKRPPKRLETRLLTIADMRLPAGLESEEPLPK